MPPWLTIWRGNPRILIFDEATSALDCESEKIIQNNMHLICQGRTVILIAHRLSAVRNTHRIVVMARGQIAEIGSHIELLRNPQGIYSHLYRLQQGGAGSGNDTLQALAAHARIQLEQSRAQGDLDKITAQLAYLLGLPAGTVFQLPATRPDPTEKATNQSLADTASQPGHPILTQALDDWLEQARQSHPAILAAKAQWQAAQLSLKAIQSEGLPALDFNLAHYRNGRPNTAITGSHSWENVIGLTLTIPLFDGFNTTYKVRAAQALADQKAIEYQATEQQALQELVQLHADAKASLNNLHMAQKLYMVAGEAAQSTQRQYDRGAADIVQLNQDISSLQQAQLELAKSQTEWNRARLQLWLQARTPNTHR